MSALATPAPLPLDECPDENTVAALIDGKLGDAEIDSIEQHLDRCRPCFELVAFAAKITPAPAATPGGLQ